MASQKLEEGKTNKMKEPLSPLKAAADAASASSGSATGNPRNKVALKPGHSLMDWVRLGHSGVDLTGVGGILREVTLDQLATHSKKNDAWIAIRGRVYNVTHYMDFHPGGDAELMRGVGQDGTSLFNQIHPWVNFESLLQKCLVGQLVQSSKSAGTPRAANKTTNFIRKLFAKRDTQENAVSMDWYQQLGTVNLQFFTRGGYPQTRVTLFPSHRDLTVKVKLGNLLHVTHLLLEGNVLWPCKVKTNYSSGVVEVYLTKETAGIWRGLGEREENDGTKTEVQQQQQQQQQHYDSLEVVSVSAVAHNTKLIILRHKNRTMDAIPIGYSVPVLANIDGVEVVRSYTPVAAALDEKFLPPGWTEDCLCLMVKQYSDSLMSRYLCTLKSEDTVNVGSASGSLQLPAKGGVTGLCLLAAGSGFTPMVNIILWALGADKKKRFQSLSLLFFSQTSRDIWWQDQLDRLAVTDVRFSVTYVLTKPDDDWSGQTGYLNLEMLKAVIPGYADEKKHDTFVCVCGPSPFRESAKRLLEEISYPEDLYFVFEG